MSFLPLTHQLKEVKVQVLFCLAQILIIVLIVCISWDNIAVATGIDAKNFQSLPKPEQFLANTIDSQKILLNHYLHDEKQIQAVLAMLSPYYNEVC